MSSTITITKKPKQKVMRVEIDLDKWERLAADLGFFQTEFIESIQRAEREIARGKIKRLKSLRSLRAI